MVKHTRIAKKNMLKFKNVTKDPVNKVLCYMHSIAAC
jgi:hypothetical protein